MHESIQVRGISESCKYNDHEICRAPGCGCDCHQQRRIAAQAEQDQREVVVASTGPSVELKGTMVCPTCRQRRPSHEKFCRMDGSRLASLLCYACGEVFDPGDKHCWACGSKLDMTDAEVKEMQARREAIRPLQTEPRRLNPAPVAAVTVPPVVTGPVGKPAKLPSSAFRR